MASPPPRPPSLYRSVRDFADLLHPLHWRTPIPDADLPRGDGHTVLFLPGMACPDLITAPTRRFYTALGYDARGWDLGFNIGPTRRMMTELSRRLLVLSDRSGRRVSLVGKSLGGLMARELAKKHPDRVRRLILVCAPIQHPIANRAAPLLYALRPFLDPTLSRDFAALSQPAPVPTTALYTKRDGLIAWQCCVETPTSLAENIELVSAYHTTAASSVEALRVVATRLAIADRPPA